MALELATRAVKLSENKYPHICGRAKRTIAHVLFDTHDYDGAFEVICDYCTEIVQPDRESFADSPERKSRLYKEWLNWIVNLLQKLPVEVRTAKIDQLIERWSKGSIDNKPLSQVYPTFISALNNLAD